MTRHKLPLIALAFGLVGCLHNYAPPPPADKVTAMCEHLRALGCESGQPADDGTSCEQLVNHDLTSGLVKFDLDCMARVPDCGPDAEQACTMQP